MSKKKPYYLKHPWDILFRENKLERVNPWNINLIILLTTLLQEMEEYGIDFRLAGTAIQNSVLIYLKKAEMLLKMEDLSKTEVDKEEVYLPPAISLPFRFEHTSTTVNDLIEALERALMERSQTSKPNLPVLPLPIPDFIEIEEYLLEIESRSDALLDEIIWRTRSGKIIRLSELIAGQDFLEVVRIFMMLLFLAQRMKIDLNQSDEEVEINISVFGES